MQAYEDIAPGWLVSQRFTADIVAVAPWVEDDPITTQPGIRKYAPRRSAGERIKPLI